MGRAGSGIEVRDSSIRVQFVLDGETIRERLTLNGKSLEPTPANIKYATRIVGDIKKRIAQGRFDYAEFFPDSPRAQMRPPNSFGALAALWLQSKGKLEAGTLAQYKNGVELWKRILGERTTIDKLTYQVLAAKIGGHPWTSAKSANNYLIVLRGIFDFEYTGRRALDNPMAGIKNTPPVKKLPDPFTADERDTILADMTEHYDPRVVAYFAFAFYTGMRPEEEIALTWPTIDFNDRMARVERVRTYHGTDREGSKTHAERDVDLVSQAIDALLTMKQYTYMKSATVFENPIKNAPWHDERRQREDYWKPALKRLGIRYRKAYNTRHTYATVALMAGVNPAYIAQQLGHANAQMLFTKYARWIDKADKGAARRALEAAMCGESNDKTKQTHAG